VTYLWLTYDLTDPAGKPRPLAKYKEDDPGTFEWAPGEPDSGGSLFLAEVLSSLPWMLQQGVRFDQHGLGQGNVHEGPAW
jgi:hypothetical protein